MYPAMRACLAFITFEFGCLFLFLHKTQRMKPLLYLLAICLILVSCEKKAASPKVPLAISLEAAYDSMRLSPDTLYHLAIDSAGYIDSSVCMRFHSSKHFTEYLTYTDTLGLHFLDSITFDADNTYAEYNEPDPSFYKTTVGYVYINYYAIGGSAPGNFLFRTRFATDTFQLRVGTPTRYYQAKGALKGPGPFNSYENLAVTIYR